MVGAEKKQYILYTRFYMLMSRWLGGCESVLGVMIEYNKN
jgi:hypothetical protein